MSQRYAKAAQFNCVTRLYAQCLQGLGTNPLQTLDPPRVAQCHTRYHEIARQLHTNGKCCANPTYRGRGGGLSGGNFSPWDISKWVYFACSPEFAVGNFLPACCEPTFSGWWLLLFADALSLSPRGLLFLSDGLLVSPGGLLFPPSGLLLIPGGLLLVPGGLLLFRDALLVSRGGLLFLLGGLLQINSWGAAVKSWWLAVDCW